MTIAAAPAPLTVRHARGANANAGAFQLAAAKIIRENQDITAGLAKAVNGDCSLSRLPASGPIGMSAN